MHDWYVSRIKDVDQSLNILNSIDPTYAVQTDAYLNGYVHGICWTGQTGSPDALWILDDACLRSKLHDIDTVLSDATWKYPELSGLGANALKDLPEDRDVEVSFEKVRSELEEVRKNMTGKAN